MAASSASNEAESRRRPARPKDKGVVDFAADAAKDIATLLQTELQLLRAESLKSSHLRRCTALIGGGALLLVATIVLLLQAAITGLVAYGLSWRSGPLSSPRSLSLRELPLFGWASIA